MSLCNRRIFVGKCSGDPEVIEAIEAFFGKLFLTCCRVMWSYKCVEEVKLIQIEKGMVVKCSRRSSDR